MLTNQLKVAALGFGITAAPIAVVAIAQNIFMPEIVAIIYGVDSKDQYFAVSSLRRDWLVAHIIAIGFIAFYWFMAAAFGKGDILRLRAANWTLLICVMAYLIMTFYYIFVPWPFGLKIVCPYLGVSDTDVPRFAFDAQSSCGAFVLAIHQLIFLGTLGLPVPLIMSLIVRIISSRRTKIG